MKLDVKSQFANAKIETHWLMDQLTKFDARRADFISN